MPLSRRSEDNGGGWTPPLPLPENLRSGYTPWDYELAEACWGGWPCTTQELREAIVANVGLAVLPERSGLIIIDCDIRKDFIVQPDGSAKLVIVEDGEQQLQKILAELGLADVSTYTVRTPSGGVHYYFRVLPDFVPAVKSCGHKKEWCVDVKASRNVWAVAPPTAGYTAVPADVAVVPYELAYYLRDGVRRLPAREGTARLQGIRAGREGILQLVRDASVAIGLGWNELIFRAGCRYGEAGATDEQALREIGEAACPWNEGERRRTERSIKSGLRHGRGQKGSGE